MNTELKNLDSGVRRNDVPILLNTIALDPNRWTEDKTPYFKLIDLLPPIAEHGFKDLEVWQYHVDRLSEVALQKLKSQLDALGISTPVLGIYPKIHLEGKDGRDELVHALRLLDIAVYLEANTVKMFVGSVASGQLDGEAHARSMKFLDGLTELATERDLLITGETHANTLFDTAQSTLETLDKLDPDVFGVCFQPYNADLASAKEAFTALQDRVWHLHYQGRKGKEICLLEEADLDYGAYTRFVVESGFHGYLCIEFVKDCVVASPELIDMEKVLANAEEDRAFVRRHL